MRVVSALLLLFSVVQAEELIHWTSTGGGWRAMVANMGVSSLVKKAGLISDTSSLFTSFATNSGSSWFSLQFFYSQPFFEKTTGTPEELYDFVIQWMNAYGNMYPDAVKAGTGCDQLPENFQNLCPVLTAYQGNWAAFVTAMLQAVSTDYGDSGFAATIANQNNRVPALQKTCLHIQTTLTPMSRYRPNNTALYLASADGDFIYTTPLAAQWSIGNTISNLALVADPPNMTVLQASASETFSFENYAYAGLYPGTGMEVLYGPPPPDATSVGTFLSPYGYTQENGPTTSQLAAITSAAGGAFSGLVPSTFAQAFSGPRALILGNPALSDQEKQGALQQLNASANAIYQNTLFDNLAVCASFPEPCNATNSFYFLDGIYSDNPSLALDVSHYQNRADADLTKPIKVVMVNADPGSSPAYNDALFLSYFDTDFNSAVEPGGFIYAPAHGTPWRSPQIFGDYLNATMLSDAAESIEGSPITTAILSGTTIVNEAFGTKEGQLVEIFLVNINNNEIPLEVITYDAIEANKEPLAALARDIASNTVLQARMEDFFGVTSPSSAPTGGGSSSSVGVIGVGLSTLLIQAVLSIGVALVL